MSEAVDYFSNHRQKLRFPWRLYHAPIVQRLRSVLQRHSGKKVLNLGSGPFFELTELKGVESEFTLCDIDPRAMELARRLHGERVSAYDVIEVGQALPYADGAFDGVVSMDVIEHVPDPEGWLADALRVLRPGGTLFLTTPNYDSWSLRFLESTALELVARSQGFSRKLLHPSKMTKARVESLLTARGIVSARVESISFGWVLAVTAEK